MIKKILLVFLIICCVFALVCSSASALTWQEDPDISEGYTYSVPLNFNFDQGGNYISCSSPYVEFWDTNFFEGAPVQWIAYNSDGLDLPVITNWKTYTTNEFMCDSVMWSDSSARVANTGVVAHPYIYFTGLPTIMFDTSFQQIDGVRVRLTQYCTVKDTILNLEPTTFGVDEFIDIPVSSISGYVLDPAAKTGFNSALDEYVESRSAALYDELVDMGLKESYLDEYSLRDYVYYDNYYCVMSMGFYGRTANGVEVDYNSFQFGDDVNFIMLGVDFNISLTTLPKYWRTPSLENYDVVVEQPFDQLDWFSWIGTALSGVMDLELFALPLTDNVIVPVSIGGLFSAILAIFGIFFVFRAFAGG